MKKPQSLQKGKAVVKQKITAVKFSSSEGDRVPATRKSCSLGDTSIAVSISRSEGESCCSKGKQ
jgi:hypothetical protein